MSLAQGVEHVSRRAGAEHLINAGRRHLGNCCLDLLGGHSDAERALPL
jgi:hypothetical protein